MPHWISHEDATERALAERGPGCMLCSLLAGEAGPVWEVRASAHAVTLLSRYPRAWGHQLVVLREHVTRFSDLCPVAWAEASEQARLAAQHAERVLDVPRVYVGSFGTPREDLALSCAHLHVHIIPVRAHDARPREVLDSSRGMWSGTDGEFARLRDMLRT